MKTRYVIAPIVILAVLIAFSAPAMAACWGEVETRANGTITNGSVIFMYSSGGQGPWTITLPQGDVEWACAHWHSWGQCPETQTATFENGDGVQQQVNISPCDVWDGTKACWRSALSPGTHHYAWRVNASPGQNTLDISDGCDCRSKWFVAVINNTQGEQPTHSGHWWHNFGLMKPAEACITSYDTWFNGTINSSASHSLWTAQTHCEKMKIWFNNNLILPEEWCEAWYEFHLPPAYIDNDNTQKLRWWNNCSGDFWGFMPWIAVLAEELPIPDLVTDIEFIPETPRPNQNFTVNVTVNNTGATDVIATFNVSLYINGSLYNKTSIAGLGAYKNKTLSFTNVSLPEGCHNFTVVADDDNDVPNEPKENSVKTRYYQVGYAIAVRSNSDFDKLVNESKEGKLGPSCNVSKRGETYYIQNCTITNCGGCGITIENTNVPFVINNCTVQNCGYDSSGDITGYCEEHYCSGVCMENVTNGKVNACTVYNNSAKGISILKNSTYIDITNNTISWHTKRPTSYGIELGRPKHSERPKFVNITNNTLFNNSFGIDLIASNCTVAKNNILNNSGIGSGTGYGIYVYGNNSNILLNNIMNSTNYGIKVYNSSENHICWNIFINNNGSVAPQAWDNSQNSNYWNTTNPIGYYYPADTYTDYTNRTGNHWSDYGGSDTNNDGIGDTPYFIAGGDMADYYPLISEHNCIIIDGIRLVKCGDVNSDGTVTGGDVTRLRAHVYHPPVPANRWAADVNCDGTVTGGDVTRLRAHVYHPPVSCCCRPPWCPRWAPWVVPPCPTQCCQWWAWLFNWLFGKAWPMCGQGC